MLVGPLRFGSGYQQSLGFFWNWAGKLSPVQKWVMVPARQGNSHRAAVRRRRQCPPRAESQCQNALASRQLTNTTASLSLVENPSLPRKARWLGANCSYSALETSYVPGQKG